MTLLSTALTVVGGGMLAHAIYSSYEHSLLTPPGTTTSRSSIPSSASHNSLPFDIVVETLFSTILLTLAIIYAAPALRPIRWNEWAGKIEREGWDPHAESNIGKAVAGPSGAAHDKVIARGGVGNPYRSLEERRAFWDVRASRQVFADFIRAGAAL